MAACGRHFRIYPGAGSEQDQPASKGTGKSFTGNYELAVDSGVVFPRYLCRNWRYSLLDMQQSADDSQSIAQQSHHSAKKVR